MALDMVKRRFLIEVLPIQVEANPSGGNTIQIASLDFRVTDNYTGMPVGCVVHSPVGDGTAEYRAEGFFPVKPGQSTLTPPDGGWGMRFDLAAEAVWRKYNETLPCTARANRWAWRWIAVGWLVVGIVLGALIGAILNPPTP